MYIFADLDFSQFLPIAIFGAVAVGLWVVMDLFSSRSTRTEKRLEELNTQKRQSGDILDQKSGMSIAGLLEKASPTFSKALEPQNEKDANKLKEKLVLTYLFRVLLPWHKLLRV